MPKVFQENDFKRRLTSGVVFVNVITIKDEVRTRGTVQIPVKPTKTTQDVLDVNMQNRCRL